MLGTKAGCMKKYRIFVFTRHRQGFRFHIAPLRNRFQIAPIEVTVSHNFDPVPCEHNGAMFCNFFVLFSSRPSIV